MVTSHWFLAFGRIRKVVHPFIGSNRPSYSRLQDYETHSTAGFPFACRPSSQHKAYRAGIALFTTKPKGNLSSASDSVAYQSQLAWKKLSMICSCRGFFYSLVRKVSYSTLANNRPIYSRLQECGRHPTAGFRLGCGAFLHYKAFVDGNASFSIHRAKENLYRSIYARKFSVSPANGSAAYQAQLAWKRLSKVCSCRGFASPTVNKITCAMSLAFTRSHMVPSLLAFIGGELACSKIAWADGEYFPAGNNLYMRAQDGHIFISSLIFSVLEFFILLLRAVYLAVLFSPIIVMAPFADTLGTQYRKAWLQLVHRTLEKAGPAFIKWGQWAATRPDLFPGDLCTELAKLHSKAPSHSFSYTKKTIEKAFGRKISDIFEDFEEEPVASGSVAQIHRASLRFRYPGQRMKHVVVAVKVRHPGVSESIRRDFVIINTVAKTSKFIPTLKWLRLDESVQQFAVFMMSQVDLAREAAHLSRFIYNFRRWKDVSFPKPLYPLVHPAVLVETYEHGESVSHYVDELGGNDRLKSALAHIGTHALLKMLLVDNFIHADMHPGNILVRVSKSNRPNKGLFKSRPHVVFLDVGMTAELSSSDRVNLLEFFKAVALRDGRTAGQCTLRLSKQQNCPNPKAFIESRLAIQGVQQALTTPKKFGSEDCIAIMLPDMFPNDGISPYYCMVGHASLQLLQEVEKSFSFWGTHEGDIVHPAECMHQLLEQVRRHKVNIDGNVCTVMVTTLVLEGWQRKLDPDYNVMQTLQNLLFKSDWAESLMYTIEGLMAP